MISLPLSKPLTLIIKPAITETFDSIVVNQITDFPDQKLVIANINSINFNVTLWEGDAYDAIGEWTNADVERRLTELYSA